MAVLFLCTRQESNLHYKIRNLASYPLNDGCLIQKSRYPGFNIKLMEKINL